MFENGRWYFKQVHFYSVFLSICYIAQDQCVSFHKVLQWFIFLQGLRVSKHTVFPVCKLKKKNQFTQVASSLLRSTWRRSFQYWVFFISNGRLLSLRNERLRWPRLIFLTWHQRCSHNIGHLLQFHRSAEVALCTSVLKPHTELLCYHIKQHHSTHGGKGTLRSPPDPSTRFSSPWGWKAVSFDELSSLEMTELLLMCNTLRCISFSGTDEPEWMCIFSETLLQYSVGSCC